MALDRKYSLHARSVEGKLEESFIQQRRDLKIAAQPVTYHLESGPLLPDTMES